MPDRRILACTLNERLVSVDAEYPHQRKMYDFAVEVKERNALGEDIWRTAYMVRERSTPSVTMCVDMADRLWRLFNAINVKLNT